MTPEQAAAYISAQAACLTAEVLGMQAENMQRQACGHSMAYTSDDFAAAIERSQCTHNAVMSEFLRANQ